MELVEIKMSTTDRNGLNESNLRPGEAGILASLQAGHTLAPVSPDCLRFLPRPLTPRRSR